MKFFSTLFSGMCVGAADIVPGISGGTVAFIIGIYERLLKSIATIKLSLLLRLKVKQFLSEIAWGFLVPFLLGVAISFVLLAKGFNYLLHHETYRVYLYASFMGLVVGSVIFCARLLPKLSLKTSLWLILGGIVAYVITGLDANPSSDDSSYDVPIKQELITEKYDRATNYDPLSRRILGVTPSELAVLIAKKQLVGSTVVFDHTTLKPVTAEQVVDGLKLPFIDIWVVICGTLAISAMLLPGISGSYLLNILGMYGIVLGALVDWVEAVKSFSFDFASFRIVFSMAVGIAFGAIVFSRVVSYLLERFKDSTLSCLTGFMIGALGAVWPFWSYAYKIDPLHLQDGPLLYAVDPLFPACNTFSFALSCIAFVAGCSIVLLLERRRSDAEERTRASPPAKVVDSYNV